MLDFVVHENIQLKVINNLKNNGFGNACNQATPFLSNEFCY